MVLGGEFAYLFWLRKKRSTVVFCLLLAFIGASSTGFYIWAGGPERSVKVIKRWHRDHFT